MINRIIQKLSCLNLLAVVFLTSCSHHIHQTRKADDSKVKTVAVSSPSCIIYRTRSDYSMRVPVTLSPDKSKIVSYPDIKDIYYQGKFAVPTLLDSAFLLDNRGIGLQVAFLDYTYEEYSQLASTPPATDLMSLLMDKDPLVDMYQCGFRIQYTDIELELDNIINSGKLNTCKKLK